MKKIRLITAAFGVEKKELIINSSLLFKDYRIDQIFYNDNNTNSRINTLNPRLKSKIPKMMEWLDHPDYDYYIWVDSTFTITDGFLEYMLQFESDNETDLFLFNHGKRSSIKAELDYLNDRMNIGIQYINDRYRGERIDEQVDQYLANKEFIDNHLFLGGCFMYSKRVFQNVNFNLMTDWLLHNALYSLQDQLSLPYLIYKHKINYKIYPDDLMKSSFLIHDFAIFH